MQRRQLMQNDDHHVAGFCTVLQVDSGKESTTLTSGMITNLSYDHQDVKNRH